MQWIIVMVYLAVVNVIALALMGIDKYRAKREKWRIPEKRLFGAALLGGSIGSWLGMRLFRHKTQHKTFVYGIPFIFLIQLSLVLFLIIVR